MEEMESFWEEMESETMERFSCKGMETMESPVKEGDWWDDSMECIDSSGDTIMIDTALESSYKYR
jgi:hypothetical protein